MSLYVDPPWSLGQTLGVSSTADGTGWVGAVKVFPDVDPKTGKVRSNRLKTCVAVRNSSGETLLPKRAVAFAAGSYSAVSGYTRLTNDVVAGVVDEFLPATGVVANDVFWVTVDGPTEYFVSQTVAVGDVVAAVTAHTTNATDAAGTGGYGATVSVTVSTPVGRVARVGAGTTNNVSVIASVVRI
jgi:hypothetical protein